MEEYKNSAINKTESIVNGEKRRENNAENKRNNSRLRSEFNKKRWLVFAVVFLSAGVMILSAMLAVKTFSPAGEYLTGASEQQSFYDLVSYSNGMEVNLSKIIVTKDSEKRQKLLGELRVQSSLGAESLSRLSVKEEDKYYTTKFINQVNDFSKYLCEKLIDGETLSSDDLKTLKDMHSVSRQLAKNLQTLTSEMGFDYNFNSLLKGDESDKIISAFKDLESSASEYPHMIYDGAFADGTEGKVAKYLSSKAEISKEKAQTVFEEYFSGYNLKGVELKGETTGVVIETYNFEAEDDKGVMLSGQISKKGGELVEFTYFEDCNAQTITVAECEEIADAFLDKCGYLGVKAVWTSVGGNIITINYASVENGIICYPDLIKVNVCRERGKVVALEASSYIYNHEKRTFPKQLVTLLEAKEKVSDEISVESSRLAIIPKGESSELLAYEFYGKSGDDVYYIYINAQTGKEVDIFKVIENSEGKLLM
ncbi:MAG: germination protein YpeB [Clostridia bacterium]|nr:germination protein YpeB [Clostridia bacterium]